MDRVGQASKARTVSRQERKERKDKPRFSLRGLASWRESLVLEFREFLRWLWSGLKQETVPRQERQERRDKARFSLRVLASWLDNFIFFLAFPLFAQARWWTGASDHFYNLEYPEAIADFSKAVAQNPSDPEMHNHLAQCLVFQEMFFANGALESEMSMATIPFCAGRRMNPSPETEESASGRNAPRPRAGAGPVSPGIPRITSDALRHGRFLRSALQLLLGGQEGLARFAARRHQRAATRPTAWRNTTEQRGMRV